MKTFIVILLITLCVAGYSQTIVQSSQGKEFYGMVMQNSGAGDPEYFRVFLSCPYSTHAELKITDGSYDTSFAILPNVVSTVNLPLSVEDNTNETPMLQAIHIVADTNISVYVIYHKLYSSDSYMALPVTSLGTDYTAVCYPTNAESDAINPGADYVNDPHASEFGIIATQDSTIVSITPSSSTMNSHPVGVPFSVILNQGETYLVYGNPFDETSDLTGSSVSATKPIAFLSGHDRAEIYHGQGLSRNCLVEQIPPTGTLGTSFITAPYAGRPLAENDYFRVVAVVDSTVILQNGVAMSPINAGQFYGFSTMTPTQIQTNNPVILAQYSQSETDDKGHYAGSLNQAEYDKWGWDPTMLIVPPTQQFLSSYIFANQMDPAFDSNFVNVVIPDTAVASLVLDGGPVATPFTQIVGSGYSYAQISLQQGSHFIHASAPFGLYMYGIAPADAYANTGGAAFKVLNGLLVTTTDIDYGGVPINMCKDSVIVFKNIGAAPITVWKLAFTDSNAADFTIENGFPPFTIAPGDSQLVTVRFCPSTPGASGNVNVLITSNAAEHPIITLHGIGLEGGLVSDLISLDCDTARTDYAYGEFSCQTSYSFLIRNTGNAPVTLDSIVVSGADASDFIVTSIPSAPATIPNGDSVIINVQFTPLGNGVRTATLQTYSSSLVNVIIPLSGIGVGAMITTIPDSIDFGAVCVDSTKDSTVMLINTSKYPAALWGVQSPDVYYSLSGQDSSDFGDSPNYPSSANYLIIPPGDTLIIHVQFTPQSSGYKVTQLFSYLPVCVGNSSVAQANAVLVGNAAYPALGSGTKLIDYGRVKIGKTRDSLITLQNFGVVTASVSQYSLSGANASEFVIESNPIPPNTVPAGKTSLIKVGFAPQSLGAKQAWLTVASDDSARTENLVELIGDATPSSYNVLTKSDTIYGHIGDTITVPVILVTPVDEADIAKYQIALQYDSTMLWPLSVSVDSSWSGGRFTPDYTFSSGNTNVLAQASDTTLTGAGTLYNVQMQVMLGDALETPLNLTLVRYTDNYGDSTAVNSSIEEGLFVLEGYCAGQGGLLEASGNYALGAVSPNPLNGVAQVNYSIAIPANVKLSLYNVLGEETQRIVDADEGAGVYTAFISSENLSPGAYMLVLESGRYRAMKRVMIVK